MTTPNTTSVRCTCAPCERRERVAGHCFDIDGNLWHDCAANDEAPCELPDAPDVEPPTIVEVARQVLAAAEAADARWQELREQTPVGCVMSSEDEQWVALSTVEYDLAFDAAAPLAAEVLRVLEPDDALVEQVARVLAAAAHHSMVWDDFADGGREVFRGYARAAFAALRGDS